MSRPELSAPQQKYLTWIAKIIAKTGRSPTLEEIGEHFESSAVNAYKIVEILVRKGYLRKSGSGPVRELELIDEEGTTVHSGQLPIIGRVAAGSPLLAVENRIGYVSLDDTFSRRGASYALLVKGESMIDAGILPGDKVIVRQQVTAEKGQIVVALINDEATVKKYYPLASGKVRLKAENPNFDDIVVSANECSIQGIVLGSYREFK
ncbi:MAG: transcriptional repressor LexA [bacterium]|nr:transcriptional repressor LexA [bacterium]